MFFVLLFYIFVLVNDIETRYQFSTSIICIFHGRGMTNVQFEVMGISFKKERVVKNMHAQYHTFN